MDSDYFDSTSTHLTRPNLVTALAVAEQKMLSSCLTNHAVSKYSKVEDALKYHLSCRGKRVRGQIALDSASALKLPDQSGFLIAAVCELLHNASLVHDDIQDKDTCRRGVQSVWIKYGEDIAICLGDLMISASYGLLAELMEFQPTPLILKKTHQAILTTIYGQGGDLASHVSKMSLFDYCELAAAKSGPLIGLPVELALLTAGIEDKSKFIQRAARDLGVAYQLFDDLKDWQTLRRTKKNGSRELNAVLIVSSDILRKKGFDAVKILAKEKITDAVTSARQIPNGAGRPLIALADKLSSLFSNY